MSAQDVTTLKRVLLDHLRAEPGLQGVQIAYGYPARDPERELIYGASGRFTRTIDALSGGMGGIAYRRTFTIDLHLQVRLPGGTVEEAEARVVALGTEVEAFLDRNPRLADLPGLLHAGVIAGEMGYAVDDDASTAALQLSLQFDTHP